ncbi:MAG: Xaa-Pro peptidase family protein [Acidilobaceae archaeon]
MDILLKFNSNLKKLKALIDEANLTSLILVGKSNITYATGIREPSGALVLSRDCGDYILAPLLDYYRVRLQAPKDTDIKAFYRSGEEPIKGDIPESDIIIGGLADSIIKVLGKCSERVGLDYNWAPATIAKYLESKLNITDVSSHIARVRSIKDEWELELIESSLRIAEEALRRAIENLREGVSELEISGLISLTMRKSGAWGEAFPTIVAFYDNTALPHHTPTIIKLTLPGPVLLDLGAVLEGYHSDLTRTLWWGSGGQEFKFKIETVVEAQQSAIDIIAPGVEAWEPDKEARLVLEKRGLSKYFNHGLGHGVGVEIHEEPYMRPASKTKLEKGMIITVEPGIYIPGLYGVRVEDLVLVTAKGRRVLTRISRIIA